MGLIKALKGAVSGSLADTWREYIYCESIPADILVTKGLKRNSKRSSNVKGDDNIISNGSIIAVNEGQCMIIVDQGKVVELCAEPGEFTYDCSTEPSLFYGDLGESIKDTFKQIGRRFTYGGDTGKDQRVYFFNTKEIMGNKYGTPNPVPFRVIDRNIGLDVDISIRCYGEYSYKITDPILFYTNVCGNVERDYVRTNIDSQLKTELLTALQPAFAKISESGIRYSSLPAHTDDIADVLNDVLSEDWKEKRGIEIFSFGISSVTATEEDAKMIKELQKNAVFRNPSMAAAQLVGAQSEAMQTAAGNPGGAFAGFVGMGLAQNAGSENIQALYGMSDKSEQGWKCECGEINTGNFCSNCGKKKSETGWKCECGEINTGNFCSNCGKKKPETEWKCECGEVNTGKFCSNCGKARN